jgi:hypothetical protein
VFPILLVVIGLGFLAGGVYTTVRGLDARSEIKATLLAQNITTPEDASIPNARVQDAATADAMADIIGVHAAEATGGETFAEMGRFLAADGSGATSDESLALLDEAGNPVPNPLRNVAFQAATLQTSLHTSHMAFNVADLVIGLGAFIAVLGFVVAGIGVALGALAIPRLARRFEVEPVAARVRA